MSLAQTTGTAMRGVSRLMAGGWATSRRTQLAAFVLLVATCWPIFFFWVPVVNLQNRKLSPFPEVTLEALLTTDFYNSVGTWVDDRFPFKNIFVDLNGRVRVGIFNTSTVPDVILTKERGWYEHKDSLLLPCGTDTSAEVLVQNAIDTAEAAQAAGKQFLFVIAPQKASLYPEKLTDSWAARYECALENKEELIQVLDTGVAPFVLNTWTPLLQQKARDPELLLGIPQDTHWTSAGSAITAEQIVNYLQPGLWEQASVQRVEKLMFGDLTRKLGIYDRRPVPLAIVSREGITEEQTDRLYTAGNIIRTYESSGDGTLLPRATIIHDSFGLNMLRQLPSFFRRLDFVHVGTLPSEAAQDRIRESDIIIVLVAERFAYATLEQLPEAVYTEIFKSLTLSTLNY